jgi:hypothetical protein
MGFWAKINAGLVMDGTAGVRAVFLYGKVSFSATGRGRRSSPTTAMTRALIAVTGSSWVRDADEHRSTRCCSGCGNVLDKVVAPTPQRIYDAAAARALAPQPLGWQRPPERRISNYRVVRGMVQCYATDLCRQRRFRHRDDDANRLILHNQKSIDAGFGPLDCMRHVIYNENPPRYFYVHNFPPVVVVPGLAP